MRKFFPPTASSEFLLKAQEDVARWAESLIKFNQAALIGHLCTFITLMNNIGFKRGRGRPLGGGAEHLNCIASISIKKAKWTYHAEGGGVGQDLPIAYS